MVNTILDGITDYFLKCPLLKEGVMHVDSLGVEAVQYTIETDMFDPIDTRYVDGSTLRQYIFNFGSREYYDMDRINNIENSGFYEKLATWIEEQNEAGDLPELPEGMTAESMEVQSAGYIFDISMQNARYRIPLRLLYFQEAIKPNKEA